MRKNINTTKKEAFNLPLAGKIKAAVSCPIISVGGYRTYEVVEKALRDAVDCVSFARPLIREPNLPMRWQKGDKSAATCISCNKCFLPGLKEGGIYCVVERKEREKGKEKQPLI